MKFLQFTDIHLSLPGEEIRGRDPRHSFVAALEHAGEHHPDAQFAVITGDLANWGETEAYTFLRTCVDAAPWPVRLVLGNHDNRQRFLDVFADHPRDPNGFVQYVFDSSEGPMVVLDTNEPRTHAGRLCDRRLAWLNEQLETVRQPAMLFLHHHPVPAHVPPLDAIGLLDGAAFGALVAARRTQLRHIFFGHCHLVMSGSLSGIPVSSLRGTNHQGWHDFSHPALLGGADLSPMYGVVFAHAEHVTVHAIDFTYSGPIHRMPTEYEAWAKAGTGAD